MLASARKSAALQPVAAISRLLAYAVVCLSAAVAAAQGHPGGGMGGGGMGPGMGGGMPGGMGAGNSRSGLSGEMRTPTLPASGESQHTLHLGPPGRWWDNKEFARAIGLNSLQQKRMDDVFGSNRDNLAKLYKNLQHEESQLEKLSRSRELDENQIFQQIDRVTQARGEAEKAYAHMLLQIRKEMTPQQVSKMDEMQLVPAQ